jgi:hypothetical protein
MSHLFDVREHIWQIDFLFEDGETMEGMHLDLLMHSQDHDEFFISSCT